MTLRLTTSALALAAMTVPAFADVTPEQVWQSWVDYYKSVGYTVTEGSRDTSGSTLTVKDVVIEGGAESGKVSVKLPLAVMTDEGNGTVKSVYSDHIIIDVAGTDTDGATYSLPLALDIPGNSTVTSGAPEDMTHEFDYPTMNATFTTVTSDGTEGPLPIKLAVANTKGKMHVAAGAPSKYDYDMTSEKLSFEGDVVGEEAETVKFSGSVEGLETSGKMTAPTDMTNLETQMAKALADGMSVDGVFKAGPMVAAFEFSGLDENGAPTGGAGTYDGKGIDASFKLSSDGLGYQVGTDAVSFELTSPQFPMPIRYGVEGTSFDMQLPVTVSDVAQPFKFAYALTGLTIGDEMWAMFDPEAKLGRDPASLEVDVTGLMKITKDLFDPEVLYPSVDEAAPADDTDAATAEGVDPAAPADDAEAEARAAAIAAAEAAGGEGDPEADAADETSPFEPVELTINQILLDALGAKVTATGNLKGAEGGDLTTSQVGEINAQFEGVNGLLDTLGAMGLIPPDQMQGVRMMLAMFAKPVDGDPDKLATQLEFKEGGSIFANGQQIQ